MVFCKTIVHYELGVFFWLKKPFRLVIICAVVSYTLSFCTYIVPNTSVILPTLCKQLTWDGMRLVSLGQSRQCREIRC